MELITILAIQSLAVLGLWLCLNQGTPTTSPRKNKKVTRWPKLTVQESVAMDRYVICCAVIVAISYAIGLSCIM